MSRKSRKIEKLFKVFCEGDTEYNYIEQMRKVLKFKIKVKPINMGGGGYSNFLNELRTDANSNCLVKFIIIDGDKAAWEESEKKNLRELVEYCVIQNKSERIPHILILNHPDFEYVSCLHTPNYKGQSVGRYIEKELGYKSVDDFKADKNIYKVLNSNGNSADLMIKKLNKQNCFICNDYSVNKQLFIIKVNTKCNWDNLGRNSSNINEFFEILSGV